MAYLLTFIVYILALTIIAVYSSRKAKNSDDFLLDTTHLGPFAIGVSVAASATSTGVLIGNVGAYYVGGITQGVWLLLGIFCGMYYNWTFVAQKIKVISLKQNNLTITDFIVNNISGNDRYLHYLCSFVTIFFFIIYITALLVSGGRLLQTIFPNVSYSTLLISLLFFISIYVIIGGFLAVIWTDLLQGSLILLVVVCFPLLYLYITESTPLAVIQQITSNNNNILAFNEDVFDFTNISLLAVGIGYLGQPHLLVRFIGINKADNLRSAKIIGMTWEVYLQIFAFIVAVLAIAYFGDTLSNPEMAFMELSQAIFTNKYILALAITTILSILITTVNSQLLLVASEVTQYVNFKSNRSSIMFFRGITVVISIIVYLLAMTITDTIFSISLYAWAGLGATFGPLILFIILGKKIMHNQAMIAVILGLLIVIIWHNLQGGIFDAFSLGPAFLIVVLYLLISSYFYKSRAYKIS